MYKFIFMLFLILLNQACGDSRQKKPCKITTNEPGIALGEAYKLTDSALTFGDDRAYSIAASEYFLEEAEQFFFFSAFIMANRHKTPEAYFHLYEVIIFSYDAEPQEAIDRMEPITKYFAIFNLLRSFELGHGESGAHVKELFNSLDTLPKSKEYWMLYSKEVEFEIKK